MPLEKTKVYFMLTVTIPEKSPVAEAITAAAESFGLDASAFATGLLAATLQRKADSPATAEQAQQAAEASTEASC